MRVRTERASVIDMIFFSSEPARDSIPLAAAVTHINTELNAEMEFRQNERVYDDIIVHGSIADWVDVVAVYAYKTVGASIDATAVFTFDADRIAVGVPPKYGD